MTLTADNIIKEAEEVWRKEQTSTIEKKANDASIEIINHRHKDDDRVLGSKTAEENVIVKEAAPNLLGVQSFAKQIFTGKAGQDALKRVAVGAGIGAVGGALTSGEDKGSGAMKGALLGALGGATSHAYSSLPGNNFNSKMTALKGMTGLVQPKTFKATDRFFKTVVPNSTTTSISNPNAISGLLAKQLNSGTLIKGASLNKEAFQAGGTFDQTMTGSYRLSRYAEHTKNKKPMHHGKAALFGGTIGAGIGGYSVLTSKKILESLPSDTKDQLMKHFTEHGLNVDAVKKLSKAVGGGVVGGMALLGASKAVKHNAQIRTFRAAHKFNETKEK